MFVKIGKIYFLKIDINSIDINSIEYLKVWQIFLNGNISRAMTKFSKILYFLSLREIVKFSIKFCWKSQKCLILFRTLFPTSFPVHQNLPIFVQGVHGLMPSYQKIQIMPNKMINKRRSKKDNPLKILKNKR